MNEVSYNSNISCLTLRKSWKCTLFSLVAILSSCMKGSILPNIASYFVDNFDKKKKKNGLNMRRTRISNG